MLQLQNQTAIAWENYRKWLIDQYRFIEARQTYHQQTVFLADGNTGKFWDEQFSHPLQNIHFMENWRLQKIAHHVDSSKNLLNMGVGSGRLERQLWKKYGVALKYTGTDITQQTLDELRPQFPGWRFLYQTFENFELPDKSFDQVLLLEVLEHIRPLQTFDVLKLVWRVLKPGGTFMISVPVNEGLERMLPVNPNQHMRLYSESLLIFELRQAGFMPQHVYRASAFPKGFWWKQAANSLFEFREPNNLVVICRKIG